MSTVFLSHSSPDKPFARKLANDLRRAGHAVWIDEAEIQIGDSLIEKIRDGIDQVDYVAAILSNASIASPWVKRELDIASNREIEENRIVVLPLLLESVDLPGFLKGKYYGDFRELNQYNQILEQLLQKLGGNKQISFPTGENLDLLKEELALAQATAKRYQTDLERHHRLFLRGKSQKLIEAITKANENNPLHSPINLTKAFEAGNVPITLGYLLWAIAKSAREGSHPLAVLITIEDKWPEVESMLAAYNDLLSYETSEKD